MKNNIFDMTNCIMCPRSCNTNRQLGKVGFCGQSAEIQIARAALHYWEEPCISGINGSGTVFFSGCNIRCIFCQNHDLAASQIGRPISSSQLAEIFLSLQEQNAHNINLVTPGHFVHKLIPAIESAKNQGLSIPILYNTGSYENVETLKALEGLIDIYMPDLKYYSPQLSQKFSNAPDYFEVACKAIDEMYRQTGICIFDKDNLMKKGILLRHLILPGHLADSRTVLEYVYNHFHDNIYVSIMNQYTPMPSVLHMHDLGHTLSDNSYNKIVNFCIELGYKNAFIQEGTTNKESFIPLWDYTGVPDFYRPD